MFKIEFKRITIIDKILANTLLKIIPQSFLPNYFTIFRFVSIPFLIVLFLLKKYEIGLILFVISASTDFIDGALARTRNQITKWGTKFDPIADKLLMILIAIILIAQFFPIWVPIIIVLNELMLVIGYLLFKKRINLKIKPNVYGKLKMIFQSVGVGLLILYILTMQSSLFEISKSLIYLSIVLSFIGLYKYFLSAKKT